MKKRFLTVHDVVVMTRHPQPYIYALLAMGKLNGKRIDGRWQIDPASVEAHIERRRPRVNVPAA